MLREGIRVLVVDDEAPARQRLADLLAGDSRIATLLEAGDGRTALRLIRAGSVDLVFLDIQMPELTGIELIREVGADRMPLTIFVTAYDQHAIQAFEANALDYLLKPFSDARFETALARAATRLAEQQTQAFADGIVRLVATRPATEPYLDVILVRSSGAIQLVRVADVTRIEGAGPYVSLHVPGREILHRASLSDLAARLDPSRFVRIHRSVVVNIDSIVRLETMSHGEFEARLGDGTRCRVSRTYRPELERRLGQTL